jgi:hypothetical protein
VEEQTQKVSGRPLDLRDDLDREPGDIAPWYQRNALTRAVAHLLGYDGSQSRFLRCTPGGVLRTQSEDAAGRVPDVTFGGAYSGLVVAVTDGATGNYISATGGALLVMLTPDTIAAIAAAFAGHLAFDGSGNLKVATTAQ